MSSSSHPTALPDPTAAIRRVINLGRDNKVITNVSFFDRLLDRLDLLELLDRLELLLDRLLEDDLVDRPLEAALDLVDRLVDRLVVEDVLDRVLDRVDRVLDRVLEDALTASTATPALDSLVVRGEWNGIKILMVRRVRRVSISDLFISNEELKQQL